MIQLDEISGLRERLTGGKLTAEDIQKLDDHLASFQVRTEDVDPSRKVVAHLPGGLDLVK